VAFSIACLMPGSRTGLKGHDKADPGLACLVIATLGVRVDGLASAGNGGLCPADDEIPAGTMPRFHMVNCSTIDPRDSPPKAQSLLMRVEIRSISPEDMCMTRCRRVSVGWKSL
jgi:hypothetical protein